MDDDSRWGRHVDAVRVFKHGLGRLRKELAEALIVSEEVVDQALAAVGDSPGESARTIRVWTAQLPADIDQLMTAVFNINEQADAYLRGLGGKPDVT
jgi:hypothetical protein